MSSTSTISSIGSTNDSTGASIESSSSSNNNNNNTKIIIETLRIYGSFYLCCLLLYSGFLYRRYPKLYNIRSWSSSSSSSSVSSTLADCQQQQTKQPSNDDDKEDNDDDEYKDTANEQLGQANKDETGHDRDTSTSTTDTDTPSPPLSTTTNNLAQTTYRFPSSITWMVEVYTKYTDDDALQDHCGMDQLCFLRALRFGRHLSFIGCCNAIWLIPLYYTVVNDNDNDDSAASGSINSSGSNRTATVVDPLSLISVSHLPSSSKRFIGTVLAAYITYLYAMYFIYLEYKWFTKRKHRDLSQRTSQNYAVYVSGIPRAYRSSHQLANYFRQCSSGGVTSPTTHCGSHNNHHPNSVVYEAHIVMETPKLDKLIERRNTVVQKLEHTVAIERMTGRLQSHRTLSKRYHHHIPPQRQHSNDDDDAVGTRNCHRRRTHSHVRHGRRTLRKIESVLTYEDELRHLNHSIITAIQCLRGRSNAPTTDSEMTHHHHGNNINDSSSQLISRHNNNSNSRRQLTRNTANKDLLAAIRADLRSDTNNDDDDDSSKENENDDVDNIKYDKDSTGQKVFHNTMMTRSESKVDLLSKKEEDDDCIEMSIRVVATTPMETSCCDKTNHFDDSAPREEEEEPCKVKNDNDDNDSDDNSEKNDIEQQQVVPVVVANKQNETSPIHDSQSSLQNSIRHGMVSGSNAVRDGIGTFISTSKVAGTTIVKSSIIAGTTLAKTSKLASTTLLQSATETGAETIRRAQCVGTTVMHSTGSVVPSFLRNRTEGKATDAGFVVFKSLYATQTVLQMIHHPKPYVMTVIPAGHVDDIYWSNVGLRHQAKRSGTLASLAATSVLCFFWSVPMAFISSLTEIGTIKESIPKLGTWIERYPFMETLLAQLAPMLLLIFNETILPVVLKYFATWEGHISSSFLEASLFVKLGCFMIIQTFFVQVLSGGIWSTLTDIVDDPENLINLLAQSLPDRSSYFIQIVLAQTFFLQSMELLRVYPLTVQFFRRYIGPRLTKKERSQPYGILHPLERPPDFWHAETFAQLLLFYMISFVYSPIAPITSIVLYFCFIVLESGYRYQFVHNYPKSCTDSGGRIWKFFIHFTLGCMVVAQFTLIGILLLKQSSYAGPAMGPLLAITILFIVFINDQHAKVSEFLPTRDCILKDSDNYYSNKAETTRNTDEDAFTMMDFAKNAYLQPSLRNSDPIEPDYEDL